MSKNNALISHVEVENKVATIRKQQVIADADVAELYGVETREVNQAVRNNLEKFPKDYMFELSKSELQSLRSKVLTTKVSAKSRNGRFEMYPTKNFYTFILLDTYTGKTFQVQWNTSYDKRFCIPISD